jgi:hypothetical protein
MTVAELIKVLSELPQDAKVYVDSDYSIFLCEGATIHESGCAVIEIG